MATGPAHDSTDAPNELNRVRAAQQWHILWCPYKELQAMGGEMLVAPLSTRVLRHTRAMLRALTVRRVDVSPVPNCPYALVPA
jgi:hypothetical protein